MASISRARRASVTAMISQIGAAWLPFAALLADRMLRQRSWQAALGLGAVLALMILGGDPQMALNVLLAASLYVVILLCTRIPEPQSSAAQAPSTSPARG